MTGGGHRQEEHSKWKCKVIPAVFTFMDTTQCSLYTTGKYNMQPQQNATAILELSKEGQVQMPSTQNRWF